MSLVYQFFREHGVYCIFHTKVKVKLDYIMVRSKA